LTEINDKTQEAPAELLENAEVSEALEILERAAFTDAEMRVYDKFWDSVSSLRTIEGDWADKLKEAEAKAEKAEAKAEKAEAKAEKAEAKAEEAEARLKQKDVDTARRMKEINIATDVISQVTGLSNAEIEAL
ncbi:MAG: hypothetical protein K6B13_07060, partial [Prevotella sp.]|nr:hypothetical protein [Prevotella sp.]